MSKRNNSEASYVILNTAIIEKVSRLTLFCLLQLEKPVGSHTPYERRLYGEIRRRVGRVGKSRKCLESKLWNEDSAFLVYRLDKDLSFILNIVTGLSAGIKGYVQETLNEAVL